MSNDNVKRIGSEEDNESSSEASAPSSMTITSDEVNFLVYRYLREAGKCSTRSVVVNLRGCAIIAGCTKLLYCCLSNTLFSLIHHL